MFLDNTIIVRFISNLRQQRYLMYSYKEMKINSSRSFVLPCSEWLGEFNSS